MALKITIEPKYGWGEIVYVKSDSDQTPYQVVGYKIVPKGFVYVLQCDQSTYTAYDFELSTEKRID